MTRSTIHEPLSLVSGLRDELCRLLVEADAHPLMCLLMTGSATRDQYIGFLVQTRHYVERTYPVLAAAGARLRELGMHDDLAELYSRKAGEEEGHDVLIDRDLRALGLDPTAALAAGPGPSVRAYNAWIDAMSRGDNPAGFLGSAYMLEGLAVERARRIADALRAAGRIPDIGGALSFLDLHAEADIAHVDDLECVLDSLEDARAEAAIVLTASVTRELYVGMLGDVMAAAVA